jgi:hypothetical protein
MQEKIAPDGKRRDNNVLRTFTWALMKSRKAKGFTSGLDTEIDNTSITGCVNFLMFLSTVG